jgi:hypothetical protein
VAPATPVPSRGPPAPLVFLARVHGRPHEPTAPPRDHQRHTPCRPTSPPAEKTLKSQTITTDTTTTAVNTEDCHGVRHIANIGDSGDTLSGSVKLDVKLQHSPDNSAWSNVTDAEHVAVPSTQTFTADNSGILATIDDGAEDDTIVQADYIGPYQYSRLSFDLTGTHTNGIVVGAVAQKTHPRKLPA